MPSKKHVLVDQSIGEDFTFEVTTGIEKAGIISWTAVLSKKSTPIAKFHKGILKKDYSVCIMKQPFEINLNGVKATYLDWRDQLEKQFNLELPIGWIPQSRPYYRYKCGGGA